MVDKQQVNIPSGRARRGRAGVVAVAAVIAAGGLWQPASAATSGTLQYTCTLDQPMTTQLTWNAPKIVAGVPSGTVTVTATATVSSADIGLLGAFGVASVEGTGNVAGTVVAPQGPRDESLSLVVSSTPVPPSGSMTFHATGTLSGLVFSEPGHAVVDVGTTLDLTLIAHDANGNQVGAPAAVSCTLNPGQNPEVFSFDITPAPTATHGPTTTKPAPPPPPPAAGTPKAGTPGAGSSNGGSSGGGSSGPGGANAGGSRSSIGGSSPASPTASTTAAPASTTATKVPIRDSATMSNRRRLPADWWLSAGSTVIVLAGAVGGVRWLRMRRRTPGR